jgi:hypothetical protein
MYIHIYIYKYFFIFKNHHFSKFMKLNGKKNDERQNKKNQF